MNILSKRTINLAMVLPVFLAVVSAQAADFCVENANDTMTGIAMQCDTVCDPGGPCRLRDAMAAATDGDRIFFDPNFFNTPRTINMVDDQFVALGGITIEGPGPDLLTIDTGIFDAVFFFNAISGSQLSGMSLVGANKNAIQTTDANLSLFQMVFSQNILAINCENTTQLSIVESLFDNNFDNGGVSADCAGVEVSDSTFSNNLNTGSNNAPGGGIFFRPNGPGTFTATNVTFSGNEASGSGGGIYLSDDTGQVIAELNNVTLAQNTANTGNMGGSGGGLFADLNANNSTLTLRNTLIGNNTLAGNTGSDPDCSILLGNVVSNGFNLVADPVGCSGLDPQDITGQDPLLGPLGANGSLADPITQTHGLLLGSPAVDAGDPNGCLDASNQILDMDQRQVLRPLGGPAGGTPRCDIGAVENGLVDIVIRLDNNNLKSQIFFSNTASLDGSISNNGPDFAPGVEVVATLPQGLNLISGNVNGLACAQAGSAISCPVGDVNVGESLPFNLTIETGNTSFVLPIQLTTTGQNTNPTDTLNITITTTDNGGGGCSLQTGRVTHSALGLVLLLGLMTFWRVRMSQR